MTEGDPELERLRRRLERERRARREAEIIAERGMRELWVANTELQDRVASRTSELERSLRSLRLEHHGCVALVRDALARADVDVSTTVARAQALIDAVAVAEPPDMAFTEVDPSRFADALVARWQRAAAGGGQLLSVEIGDGSDTLEMDWAAMQAAADLLIDGCIRTSTPGALTVVLDVSSDQASLVVSTSGSPVDAACVARARRTPSAWVDVGPLGPHLAIVNAIAVHAGGSLDVDSGDGGTITTVFMPIPATA